MSIPGIEECRENSILFAYTDAPAKDEDDRQAVIDASNAKNIELRIFLQDDLCGKRRKRDTGYFCRYSLLYFHLPLDWTPF